MPKMTKALADGYLRAATTALFIRSRISSALGKTFGGKRDFYEAFGYKKDLTPQDFRDRYTRDELAGRIVDSFPDATWRGGPQVIEDEDPDTVTPFEQAFIDLDLQHKVWANMRSVDKLAQLGHYAVMFFGTDKSTGDVETPLESASELAFLAVYAEDDAQVHTLVQDVNNPRFAMPEFYTLRRTAATKFQKINTIALKAHYSRLQHVLDGELDDKIYGTPRLERVWNRLDDIMKVAGGGSEAFFRRVEGGKQFDVDPTQPLVDTVDADPDADRIVTESMRKQIEEYEHGWRRYLTTRGVKINDLGSDVADFASQIASLVSLISAGTGIPQRVLMGSEQGKLAAKQDRANWDNRVQDRQRDWAEPKVVRPFVDRMIELGVLPAPAQKTGYNIRWSSMITMDDEQRATVAGEWASLNTKAGMVVVVPDEIRERVLQLPPLSEVDMSNIQQLPKAEQQMAAAHARLRNAKLAIQKEKGGRSPFVTLASNSVHNAADRFRLGRNSDFRRSLRRGALDIGRSSHRESIWSRRRTASASVDRKSNRQERPIIASVVSGRDSGTDS